MLKKYVLIGLVVSLLTLNSQAQNLDSPGAYISAINNATAEMKQKYMSYMSAAAHGRRARKVEKLRQQVLQSIDASRDKTIMLPLYKGDNSLRQASSDYIKLCYNIFNEDYNKIVNLEEIAEQSIDQMEAYLLLQEKTNEKVKQANERIQKAVEAFALKNNVTLISTQKDELGEKMEKASKLNQYINQVFLIFFKANFQDGQVVKHISENKVGEIEQSRSALLKYAEEGLIGLENLKTFEGDPSLAASCREFLNFCKRTATKDVPVQIDFFVKKDQFTKLQKAMEANSNRTKEDIDKYNEAVKEANNRINTFNQLNHKLNTERNALYKNWENAQKTLLDTHMPYYK